MNRSSEALLRMMVENSRLQEKRKLLDRLLFCGQHANTPTRQTIQGWVICNR